MCAITAICSDGGVNDELDEYLDKAFWNCGVSCFERRLLGLDGSRGADRRSDERCVLEGEAEKV